MSTKHCPACDQTKALEKFYKNKNGRLGRAYRCIKCERAVWRAQADKTPQSPAQLRSIAPWLYAKPFASEDHTCQQ